MEIFVAEMQKNPKKDALNYKVFKPNNKKQEAVFCEKINANEHPPIDFIIEIGVKPNGDNVQLITMGFPNGTRYTIKKGNGIRELVFHNGGKH